MKHPEREPFIEYREKAFSSQTTVYLGWKYLAGTIILVMLSLAGWQFLINHPPTLDCGSDPQSAKEKGCIYDVGMVAWLPKECYDKELDDQFRARNWTWARDQEATDIVPYELAVSGTQMDMWVTFEFHKRHCLYTWAKFTRAFNRGWYMFEYLADEGHVRHCEEMALNPEDISHFTTRIRPKYPKCMRRIR